MRKGYYNKNQNIKNQKEHQKNVKASEHRKVSYYVVDQNIKNQGLFSSSLLQQSERRNSDKLTFDVLILPLASKKIRMSKIKNINYLWRVTYGYQGQWGVRLG